MQTLPLNLCIPTPAIVLLTGPSGSGKTKLAPSLIECFERPTRLVTPNADRSRPLIEWWRDPPEVNARRLSAMGLGDPFTWARTWDELSEGQKERATLADLLEAPGDLIVIDEYLARLDRLTARAVAWATQRAIRKTGKSALLITSNDDIASDLAPDVVVRLGWSAEPHIFEPDSRPPSSTVVDDLLYRRGTYSDWRKLKPLHYEAGDPATVQSYHVLEHPSTHEPAAVAILSYPDLHSSARNIATQDAYRIGGSREQAQRLNREVLRLSRLVVTPELRGCGLAKTLIGEAIKRTSARFIECTTALGRFNPFLAQAGFVEVPQTTHPTEAELLDWATQSRVPEHCHVDAGQLALFVDSLSVRECRHARRVVWDHYHHFVLHRRTRSARPGRIPGPNDRGWPEAWMLAAKRLTNRPSYWIIGALTPAEAPPCPVDARSNPSPSPYPASTSSAPGATTEPAISG